MCSKCNQNKYSTSSCGCNSGCGCDFEVQAECVIHNGDALPCINSKAGDNQKDINQRVNDAICELLSLNINSVVTNTQEGNTIATHSDGSVTVVDINETITALSLSGTTLTYEKEGGTTDIIDLSNLSTDETITNLGYDSANFILSYTNESNTTTAIDLSGLEPVSLVNGSVSFDSGTRDLTVNFNDGSSSVANIPGGTGSTLNPTSAAYDINTKDLTLDFADGNTEVVNIGIIPDVYRLDSSYRETVDGVTLELDFGIIGNIVQLSCYIIGDYTGTEQYLEFPTIPEEYFPLLLVSTLISHGSNDEFFRLHIGELNASQGYPEGVPYLSGVNKSIRGYAHSGLMTYLINKI